MHVSCVKRKRKTCLFASSYALSHGSLSLPQNDPLTQNAEINVDGEHTSFTTEDAANANSIATGNYKDNDKRECVLYHLVL